MLRDFFHNFDYTAFSATLMRVAAVLLCIMVHEVSHGLAANLLGDPTAKRSRRLSFNPLRHIDPVGALMLVVVGFGWAKPVPVDLRNFKNPKSGMAITSLAGPLSNILLAYLALLLYFALLPLALVSGSGAPINGLTQFLVTVALLSVGLGIFNLIPIPPLDGFKVLGALLPDRLYYKVLRYERYGVFVLMMALWLGVLDAPLSAARGAVVNLLIAGSNWIFDLGSILL